MLFNNDIRSSAWLFFLAEKIMSNKDSSTNDDSIRKLSAQL